MNDPDTHLDRIRAQFGKQAEVYARMRQTTDERGLKGIVQLSGADDRSRVLDVACGPGFLSMAFAARCRAVIGIDATEQFLAMARTEAESRGLRNIEFRSGNAEALPFKEGEFDLVACRAAYHHFPRPARVLAEMARVAGPGGHLVIADMLSSEDPEQAAYHNRLDRLCDPTHVRALPPSEFERLFADAGLSVQTRITVSIDIEVDEWIAHGAPDAAAEAEIRALLADSLDTDRCGLNLRRQNGQLWFSYPSGVFVVARA
jgi:ubiquinone/menaquinone biosynthesis C-methylase UbiE